MALSPDPAAGVDPINRIDRKSKLLLTRAELWSTFKPPEGEKPPGARDRATLAKAITELDDRLEQFEQVEKVSSHDEVAAARAARRATA